MGWGKGRGLRFTQAALSRTIHVVAAVYHSGQLEFVSQLGRCGAGHMSPTLAAVGTMGSMVVVTPIFVLAGWRGGNASILADFGGESLEPLRWASFLAVIEL